MHHILVVDDESDICDVLKLGFEADGHYRVRCASNRLDALSALRSKPLDLALLDILMRENAGADLEALAAEQHVPVLRMTGHPDIVQRARQQGVPILAKPFRISDVVAKVDRLLLEAERLHREIQENIHTGRELVSKAQADLAATQLLWAEMTMRWQRVCRRVLKDEPE